MKRYKHNLSHYNLVSGHPGYLLPVGCVEVLPGDTFDHSASVLLRMSPLMTPVMHPVHVRVHHFYMPTRLLMDDWEDFITGNDPDAVIPQITVAADPTTQPLLDYLFIPPVTGLVVNDLKVRMYNSVFNEYYRDQDLVTERSLTDVSLARIAWEKDYLSSARPWAQKGADVVLPLGTRAPIKGIGLDNNTVFSGSNVSVYETDGTGSVNYVSAAETSTNTIYIEQDPDNPGFPNAYADLSLATPPNILDVRRAFALQRYEEARARYGSRFVEYLRYLGIRPSDARLQRPEYLGGGKQTISFSEVLQTAVGEDEENVVGTMRGHGIAATKSRRYRRFFEEHGFVMSLLSVRPRAMYMNGVHRTDLRRTKEDFYQKELELIGQQEIMLNEVYATSGAPGYASWNAYADRYRDYREHPSQVSGEFRSLSLIGIWPVISV